jgi:hypothetical protein
MAKSKRINGADLQLALKENNKKIKEELNSLIDNLPSNIREYAYKATAASTTDLNELTTAGIWYEYNKVCTGVPEELEGATILALIKNETLLNITMQTLTVTSNGVISSWQRRWNGTVWGSWYKNITSNDMSKLRTMYVGIGSTTLGILPEDSTTTLTELFDLMDEVSQATFFINSSRYLAIYEEILAGIQTAYPNITSISAHVTIRKNGTTKYITVEDYGETSNKFECVYLSSSHKNWVKYITTSDTESSRMYLRPSNFGCSANDAEVTLTTMIDAMDATSHVNFWINNSSQYVTIYNEILTGIKAKYPNISNIYGNVDIWKIDGTAYIKASHYDNPRNVFTATYTTVNNLGWSEWEKVVTGTDLEEIGETITANVVEVGGNDNITVYATLCLQKLSATKCNLFISYKITANTETDTTHYPFMSGSKIREALGVSSLTGNAVNSQVIFKPVFESSDGNLSILNADTSLGLMGYTGLMAKLTSAELQLGRFHTSTGSYGSWNLTKDIFKPNTYGQINFYGASYSI